MGKYDPLRVFLESSRAERLPVKFSELEALLGFELPRSKQYPAWWSNSPTNNPMTKAWLAAGYVTEQVDTTGERLVFKRARSASPPRAATLRRTGAFPGYGAMKGTLRLAAETDLTKPADEAWAQVFE
jgi:hypothetical protein